MVQCQRQLCFQPRRETELIKPEFKKEVRSMTGFMELDGNVAGFGIENGVIDCLSGNELVRLVDGAMTLRRTVFEKSGSARFYAENSRNIVISDFCTLHSFSKESFEQENAVRIGNDLSSDICALFADEEHAYCAVRNGGIAKVRLADFTYEIYATSDASIWEIECFDGMLVCGTVDGHILKIDRDTMGIVRDAAVSKKNIKSLRMDGNRLYAASQDMKLYVLDRETLDVLAVKRNMHKYMYYIAGITDRCIVTVSHPASEIAVWEKESLDNVRVIREPLRLSGPVALDGDILYYASRNFNGIKRIKI